MRVLNPKVIDACHVLLRSLQYDHGPEVEWTRLILEAELLKHSTGYGLANVWTEIHRGDYGAARATLDHMIELLAKPIDLDE